MRRILNAFTGEKVRVFKARRLKGGFHNTLIRLNLPGSPPLVLQVAPLAKKMLFWHERDMLKSVYTIHSSLDLKNLPVPPLLYHDFSGAITPHNHLIWGWMPGKNWYYEKKHLSSRQTGHLYEQLGRLTRRIHGLQGTDGCGAQTCSKSGRLFGFPASTKRFKTWSSFLLRYARELNRAAMQMGLLDNGDPLTPLQAVRHYRPVLDRIQTPRLVHGDLWIRNILVQNDTSSPSISALLDFERAVWGDPWYEWILYGLPLPAAFWSAYGKPKPTSPSGRKRLHCYHLLGLWQAALEENLYFTHRAKARRWMGEVRQQIAGLGAVRGRRTKQ